MEKGKFNGDTGRRITPVADRPSETHSIALITFAIGQEIESRYKVLSLLGRGGMGAVYLVEDKSTKTIVAMKTISSAQASESALKRFHIEAQATSLLDHESLIKVHDFGLIAGEHPYFVMDFCEGFTLGELIKAEGPLPINKALELFLVICRAVAYAHGKGVVHRDLKPSNIMVTSTTASKKPEVRVLDFGIAKVFRDETAFNTLTRTGEIIGSPYYMSPEQCLGKKIDSRSDIYSLGCVFFESLVGCPPFIADNPLTIMLKHQAEPAPTLKEATLGQHFPSDLERIFATMLAKDPGVRYSSLDQVADDLVSVQRGVPLGAVKMKSQRKKLDKRVLLLVPFTILLVAAIFLLLKPRHSDVINVEAVGGWPSLEAAKSTSKVPDTFYSAQVKPDVSPTGQKQKVFFFPRVIGYCGWGDDDLKFIPAQGKKTLRLPLSLALKASADELAGFRKDEVRLLRIRGLENTDPATNYIKAWTALDTLDLGRSNFTDACLTNLNLPSLSNLNVADSDITGAGLLQLPLNRLRSINVSYDSQARLILPKVVGDKIEILRMVKCGVIDDDLKLIAKMPNISYLDLRWNDITDAQLKQLLALKKLETLGLSNTKVNTQVMEIIPGLRALQHITVSTEKWSDSDRKRLDTMLAARKIQLEPSDTDATK